MSEWSTVTFKDVAEFNPRESLKRGEFSIKVGMDKLQPFCRDIPEVEYEEFTGGTKFRNYDTIMARITPCLENGKTAMVNVLDEGQVGFGSTEYIVLRAKKGLLDPYYLYYLVCSPLVRDPAIKSMVGSSGRQRVQTDVIQNLELTVPPLQEQQKIGGVLKKIDDKILANTRINRNLSEQAMAIYKQMIIDAADDSWTDGMLSDVAIITMGQSPKGDTYNEEANGEVFYQGRAEFGDRFPTRRLFTTDPKRMAEENDVLMSVRAPVGDLNVAYERCCIGRGLASIHSKDGNQSFVLYTMYALKTALDQFNGEGTVFGSINRDALNKMAISIPPKAVMDAFEEVVSPMDLIIKKNYEETCSLVSLRDSLLPKLMSGELDVSDLEI